MRLYFLQQDLVNSIDKIHLPIFKWTVIVRLNILCEFYVLSAVHEIIYRPLSQSLITSNIYGGYTQLKFV